MKSNKKGLWLGIGVAVVILLLLGSVSGFIVKMLWMKELSYSAVFWKIKSYEALLFAFSFIIVILFMGWNIRLVIRYVNPIRLNFGQGTDGAPVIKILQKKTVHWLLWIGTGLFALIFALVGMSHWDELLRFVNAQPFHQQDPIFGKEIAFYIFRLPFLEFIQNSVTTIVVLAGVLLLFIAIVKGDVLQLFKTGSFSLKNMPIFRRVLINAGIASLLLGWGYYLDRFHLLHKNNDLIFGANYTDIHILVPVYWMLLIGYVLFGLYLLFGRRFITKKRLIGGPIILLCMNFIGLLIVPATVQNFKVDPSELAMETPFIKNNIQFTRSAYELDSVKVKNYDAVDTINFSQIKKHQKAIRNIRIWDQNLTVQTYKQLQEIRSYYEFYNIDLDRYQTPDGYRQVLISARELTNVLSENAQTWVNKHLQYTHGYGVVMSPTTEKTPEGSPVFYIKDLPPTSNLGMEVKQPAIYYGESKSGFKIVNTEINELDYPKGDHNVYTNYKGKGGVPINSIFSQLLFAWEFSDINILLTNYIHQGSRIQFWNSIETRVKKVAPFLKFDKDPYIVLNEGKIYWMIDGYTEAKQYPYASPYSGNKNYIRNAVKVIVDAYEGSVKFYVASANDPVIKVYQKAFPGMFHSLQEMPEGLRKHIKYPKDLFEIQLEKFSVFHMTTPQVFYNQEDLWERPTETYGGKQIKMRPYYLLGTLPESKQLEYLLISPMTPKQRDNMISWMVVKSDEEGYGQIINYELPKERLFLGPAQIEAKINQNTTISKQLSLWDQKGSKVIRGNLMIIPIDSAFLYVEPVFLFSTNVNIPQLKRVIATSGGKVVMEKTLQDAIYALFDKEIGAEQTAIDKDTVVDGAKNILPVLGTADQDKIQQLIRLWKEMKTAMQAGEWEKYGEKMDEINALLGGK